MKSNSWKRVLKAAAFILLVILVTWAVNRYGVAQLRAQVDTLGFWAPLGVFLLRFSSVVIPALPGTAYSLLAGSLFGFTQGLLVICVADLASCSLSFALSRYVGRDFIQKLVGERFMGRVDRLAQQHLEDNFFMMVAFLMTGFFDFVAYGVGLTKAAWWKFLPTLVVSIALSNPPIVALGAGIFEQGKLLLVFALLGVFGLALIMGFVRKRQQKQS